MFEYILIITLYFSVGAAKESVQIGGKTTYPLEVCKQEGQRFADWLYQDFVDVEWKCVPVNKTY